MSRHWTRVKPPQNGWSSGNSSAEASIASATIASTRLVIRSCQRRRASASSSARVATSVVIAWRSPRSSRKIRGVAATVAGDAERSSSSSRGCHGSLGAAGTRKVASVAVCSSHSATSIARLKAGRVGVLGTDPRGVRLEAEALECRSDRRCRGVLAGRRGGGLARLGVDPVDLGPATRARRPRAPRVSVAAWTAARKPPWAASLASWMARGSAPHDAVTAAASWAS